jgi:hypothetical protein
LISFPFELLISIDTSNFIDISLTPAHDELLQEINPPRMQTLLLLYEYLKPHCSILFEAPAANKPPKKKKRKNQKQQPKAPQPVTGEFLSF